MRIICLKILSDNFYPLLMRRSLQDYKLGKETVCNSLKNSIEGVNSIEMWSSELKIEKGEKILLIKENTVPVPGISFEFDEEQDLCLESRDEVWGFYIAGWRDEYFQFLEKIQNEELWNDSGKGWKRKEIFVRNPKYSWDLLEVNKELLSDIESDIKGEVEPNATLKGSVVVGEGTLVKNGAYIEGPVVIGENCVIGPNCYLRGATVIGNGSRVGNAVEIKNSIIGDNVNINHLSYIGDSILDNNVNIAAGNITSNLRHDHGEIITRLGSRKINTGRNKLGVIIGEGVHTGINSSFYPGRKIWPGLATVPGEIIKTDKVD